MSPLEQLIALAKEGYSRGWDGLDARDKIQQIDSLATQLGAKLLTELHGLVQVGFGCPSAWEARTALDQYVYIRYRYGQLTVDVDSETVLELSVGEHWEGIMSTHEMLELTRYTEAM